MSAEFDRQLGNLLGKGYPALAGVGEDEFAALVEPLRARVPDGPFAIVVSGALVPAHAAVPLVELDGKPGFTDMEPDDLAGFGPVVGVEVPPGPAYLVTGFDAGTATLNVTPDDAMETIVRAGRSPLTIDEGVALVTQFPELLRDENCFSMLGSRCGDRRVTALWISKGRPRLGWCWAGNPHTWLGSASCAVRLGLDLAPEVDPEVVHQL